MNTPLPPRGAPYRNPTTGEIAVSLEDHERRIGDAEDVISETRKSITNVERMIGAMNEKLANQISALSLKFVDVESTLWWVKRFAFATIIGVFGLVGARVLEVILKRGP